MRGNFSQISRAKGDWIALPARRILIRNPELARDANDRHVTTGVPGFFAVAEKEVAAAGGAQVTDEDILGI